MQRIITKTVAAVLSVLLTTGCVGSKVWAEHASQKGVQQLSDFDLCNGYEFYNVNVNYRSEILRRGLLTEEEWAELIHKGPPFFKIGEKKCLAFANQDSFWIEESQQLSGGSSTSVWRYLGCEPTIFTWFGRLCDTYIDIYIKDGRVYKLDCHPGEIWKKTCDYINSEEKVSHGTTLPRTFGDRK